MSGTIRDDEYDWLQKAVVGCKEEGGAGEILDRVLSVVEDILEAREEPIRALCREWATDSLEFDEGGLGFKIRQNAEAACAHEIFELLNEWDQECEESESEDDTDEGMVEDTEPV